MELGRFNSSAVHISSMETSREGKTASTTVTMVAMAFEKFKDLVEKY